MSRPEVDKRLGRPMTEHVRSIPSILPDLISQSLKVPAIDCRNALPVIIVIVVICCSSEVLSCSVSDAHTGHGIFWEHV